MSVAVVHTFDSPCRCHESILAALHRAGISAKEIDSDSLPDRTSDLVGCRFAFDMTDTWRGCGDRTVVSRAIQEAGLELIGSPPEIGGVLDDKIRCREALSRVGLPVAPSGPCIGWPRILKSPRIHGSRSVRLVRDLQEESEARESLTTRFGPPVLVEEFVPGKEVAVGVVGRARPWVLPPVEIRIPSEIYTAEDKWNERNPAVLPAELPESTSRGIRDGIASAVPALGLRDMARFDLRVRSDGTWVVLEVNIRPSLEPVGLLAAAAALEGTAVHDLVLGLLAGAHGPGSRPRASA